MQNRTTRSRSNAPWIVLAVAAGVIVLVIILSSLLKKPPEPARPHLLSRVNLVVQSNVGGAEVYVDGEHKGITSDTEYKATVFNLPRKTYEVTLKKESYQDATASVEVTGTLLNQPVRIEMKPVE